MEYWYLEFILNNYLISIKYNNKGKYNKLKINRARFSLDGKYLAVGTSDF